MSLRLFNTMGRKLEEFKPIKEGFVGFYGCGPTVYNYAHIGNLRAYVFLDTLDRTLTFLGYDIKHVMNITDVGHLTGDGDEGDDKMVKTAEERHQSVLEVAKFYTDAFMNDIASLNIRQPDVICNATDHIPDMIALIEKIEAGGHTYMAGGNLYFDITTYPDYGKLANLNLDELKEGSGRRKEVVIDGNKRNPGDFVLWFTKSKFENQAMTWDSPWGRGYPGWHIECSAMSLKYLGEPFDFHGGGSDLIFPHHENEIAQSEACTGRPFARYWMHNGYITMNKEKVSKSKGNFFTVRELLEEFDGETLRFFLLQGHYRNPIEFSKELIHQAKAGLDRIRRAKENLQYIIENGHEGEVSEDCINQLNKRIDSFKMHMEDDLNTADAITDIFEMVTDINSQLEKNGKEYARLALAKLQEVSNILGFLQREGTEEIPENVKILAGERQEARKNKDFKRADAIRDEVLKLGYEIKDTPEGMQIVKA